VKKEHIYRAVREGYAQIARDEAGSCCGPARPAGGPQASCGCGPGVTAEAISKRLGYDEKDMRSVPEGANLGLGCGNPLALAGLNKGETVVDLGSGAGFDCFLAAKAVGPTGRVIGVDMTPEMIERARQNAAKGKYRNVEFRLGEIENLPVADKTADVIISNCVINLVPDKGRAFQEAFRILKPGGRLMVSDIVLLKALPAAVQESVAAYIGCLSGASIKSDYLKAIRAAGFGQVEILEETSFPFELMANDPTAKAVVTRLKLSRASLKGIAAGILSVKVAAHKPRKEQQ
jgi:SAM-dependent methyltransferase